MRLDAVLTRESIFKIYFKRCFGIKPYFVTFVKHLNTGIMDMYIDRERMAYAMLGRLSRGRIDAVKKQSFGY